MPRKENPLNLLSNRISDRVLITLFTLLCISILVLRIFQIWANPIQDFDTNSFILMMQGGFYPNFTYLIDLAHPGLLAVYFAITNFLINVFDIPPIYLWNITIISALLLASILLYSLLKSECDSKLIALFGVTVYLLSPVISDISAKSEENLLFHPIYLFIISIICKYLNNKNNVYLILLAATSIILAALHVQPFLIIFGGLSLLTLSEWYKSKKSTPDNFVLSLKTLVTYSSSGFIYYAVIHYAFYNPMVVKAYSNNIYSLFHNDSLRIYLEAYLLFLQGHLFTGLFPVISMTLLRIEPTLLAIILGFVFLFFILWTIQSKRSFVEYLLLAALGFVFLYEPTISERWDTVLIALIIASFTQLTSIKTNQQHLNKLLIFLPYTVLLAFGLYHIPSEMIKIKQAMSTQHDLSIQLLKPHNVHTNLDSGQRFAVNLSPRDSMFHNIEKDVPTTESLVFLENASNTLKSKFNIECKQIMHPNLCLIENSK